MACSTDALKYVMYFANLIVALIAIALVAIAIRTQQGAIENQLMSLRVELVVRTLITVGIVVFSVACVGCTGAVKEVPCLLIIYSVTLLALSISQVGVGVVIILPANTDVNHSDFRALFAAAAIPGPERNQSVVELRDWVQTSRKCCGVESPDDYPGEKPPSCCVGSPSRCPSPNHPLFTGGCVEKKLGPDKTAKIMSGAFIGIAVVEFIMAVVAIRLCSLIRSKGKIRVYAQPVIVGKL